MKKKNKDSKSRDFFLLILCILILLFFCVPAIINSGLIKWDFKTALGLGNAEWLSFWGSYTGSALGVLATFTAFTLTYLQSDKQNKAIQEQNQKIQEQNVNTQNMMIEQRRLQSLPFINAQETSRKTQKIDDSFLSFDNNGYYYNPRLYMWTTISGSISLTNIGVGPAIDVTISNKSVGHFSVSERKEFTFEIPAEPGYLELSIKYRDREGRLYTQVLKLTQKDDVLVLCGITPPIEDQ